MLTNHQLLHFDVETLSTVSTLCKGKHAKIERKLKSSLAMLRHLQERAVKQEHLERDEPAGSKPGSMQAEPVGVNAENTQKMQNDHAEEESIQDSFLAKNGKYMLGRLQQLLDLSTEKATCLAYVNTLASNYALHCIIFSHEETEDTRQGVRAHAYFS